MDYFNTISKPSEGYLKDKGSKFFAYAFPFEKEEKLKSFIEELKKKHFNARHWCYAFRIGEEKFFSRSNDDGEPSSSAGKPILGQIQSFELSNILIVVVRYFGGTLLGVRGLINAYGGAAKLAIENASIVKKAITDAIVIHFPYELMNEVQRIIKQLNLSPENQKFEMDCEMEFKILKSKSKMVFDKFNNIYGISTTSDAFSN